MARPTSLTPELQQRIVEALRKGNFRKVAAASAGIHRNTLTNWEKWGDEGREPYADFCVAMQAAEAEAEMQLLDDVRCARPGVPGVSGADVYLNKAWMLERRWPERWSGKVRVTVQEIVDGMLDRVAKVLDADNLAKVIDATRPDAGAAGADARH